MTLRVIPSSSHILAESNQLKFQKSLDTFYWTVPYIGITNAIGTFSMCFLGAITATTANALQAAVLTTSFGTTLAISCIANKLLFMIVDNYARNTAILTTLLVSSLMENQTSNFIGRRITPTAIPSAAAIAFLTGSSIVTMFYIKVFYK